MLQFITNTEAAATPAEQVKGVIAGGCRWVQIRMKDASDEEISRVVEDIKPLCLETETFLILNDRVELAKKLDVGGVHLGKTDMLPSKARMLLGPAAVIGVTANTIDDIKAVRGGVPSMEAGSNGIAVSGAIAFADDISKATAEFISALKPFMKD